ncbi:septal ring lytic transglycosylase RlpA family protein [Psychrobacter sp. FDAARGOS_221]|uniref:septal ring lytic transglycosylase RlpA family protein n=1 Tax=Psychrobacter sp. FDAARGOS_221 TaxID=1975705 RepID=UPI000BB572DA|nr:septal ring lytic transglycosylase RlpA family protein [Psychrobacter sp. FDAARGOS_221]PNK61597.1 septal ring lytic transglycosylase RlpA family protein [Psychrobacter sp. FDAARGOS_221]
MKTFSSALCALACMVGASTLAHATDSKQTISVKAPSDIDSVLNELARKQNHPTSLLQTSFEPSSLATNSSLINSKASGVNQNDEDVLSHLTLVASNAVNKFKQSGRASWYGGKFHGRKTASGERFNMHSLTAAHPSLPFNTLLKVTNTSNGQSVIVKVNDRGPFHGNRVLDLSYGAAKKIGLVSRGIANVTIERVSAP